MGNTDRIAKNTVFLYLRSLIVLLISLYTSRVILQVLGVEDYGVYCVVGGVIGIMGLLTQVMSATYQRYLNVEMGKKNTAGVIKMFQLSLLSQSILAIIILVLGETIGLWFVMNKLVIPENRLTAALWVYQASIISFIIGVFSTPFSASIVAYEKMGFYAALSILDTILRLGIVFLIKVLSGDSLIIYAYLMTFISFINIIIKVVYCKRKIPTAVVKFLWDPKELKSMFIFSCWSIFGEFGNVVKAQGISIVLNMFFGPVVNAAQGVATQVQHGVDQFIHNFQASFRPQLTKSYSGGDYFYMKNLYYSATKFSYYMIYTLSLPIILETPFILSIWLGNNVPEYTVEFTRLILLTSFISAFANPTSCIAYATGNIKWFSIAVGLGNVLILPVAWVFLKLGYSPISTLVVSLLITSFIQIVRLIITSKTASILLSDYFKNVFLPTALYSFITPWAPFILSVLLPVGLMRLFLTCIVSVLSSALFCWLVGLNKQEKAFLLNKIQLFLKLR